MGRRQSLLSCRLVPSEILSSASSWSRSEQLSPVFEWLSVAPLNQMAQVCWPELTRTQCFVAVVTLIFVASKSVAVDLAILVLLIATKLVTTELVSLKVVVSTELLLLVLLLVLLLLLLPHLLILLL